ncbi:MAG: TonB-dependent receptor [Gammaproteobacteria bacterium]|nr:TonB-dependent receptor [Gammaproteobacteria bacterium]MDH4315005.1 TonB-dependent receptor [Gammaproteobacteria bacterium]MDH5215161.1 TonB-dependent receptor [Gammaproteobacteria bacterium]MDH5499598.1 TonB-dependent receptor [Gammaproteobacteria bacterium]
MSKSNARGAQSSVREHNSDVLIERSWQLNSWTPIATAVFGAIYPGASALAQSSDESSSGGIEEIIVTATKRAVDLQDVPQSITAFSNADIEKMVFKNMEDYMKALPSASLVNSMPGRNSLAMRGITTGSSEYRTDSQVAVYLDEQPVTSISQQPEIRMIDIQRLESLPGPQGTLFGSSSQSGTLRIITNKPNHDGFSGQGDATIATTHGGDASYDVSGHLNIPVIDDKLALRVVAFTSRDGGYVDNVVGTTISGNAGAFGSPGDNSAVAKDNQNEYDVYGGRIAALWDVSENWDVDLSYIAQNSKATGTWESDPFLGDYKVTRFFDEYRNDDWWQTSATIRGDLGFAEVVSTTSYFERESSYEFDNMVYNHWQTSYYGIYNGWLPYDFQYEFGSIFNFQVQRRTAQELRLTSLGDSKLQWMVGAFYDEVYDAWDYGAQIATLTQTNAWDAVNNGWDVDYLYNGYIYTYHYNGACDYAAQGYDVACPLAATNRTYVNDYSKTIKQTAVFGELTYHLTDDWSVTGGIRWFEFDRDDYQVYQAPGGFPPYGSYGVGEGIFASQGKNSDTVLKFSTQYNVGDDQMVYFTYSEGFRLGGNNSPRAVATGSIPATYGPDLLRNYEVGLKSEWLDNRLQFNITLFKMEWSDIQINDRVDGPWWLTGTFNGETGESRGIEVSGEWRATDNLSIQGSAFFNKSEYTADTLDPRGNLYLLDGQEMPNAPDTKFWLAAEYTVPGFAGLNGDLWFRYDTSYQSETWDNLDAAQDQDLEALIPSWSTSNLQVGVNFESGWDVSLMARNVWNESGINSLYNSTYASDWFGDPRWRNERTLQRPRTISLNLRKRF